MGNEKRMSDAVFARLFPLACESLGGGTPVIMRELSRAREAELVLQVEVDRLRAAEVTREKEGA